MIKKEYLVNVYENEDIDDFYFIYVSGKNQSEIDRKLENHCTELEKRGHNLEDIDIKFISRCQW